jgi:hypothetical protein
MGTSSTVFMSLASLSRGQIHPQLQAAPAPENWQVGLGRRSARSSNVPMHTCGKKII